MPATVTCLLRTPAAPFHHMRVARPQRRSDFARRDGYLLPYAFARGFGDYVRALADDSDDAVAPTGIA
jgi:hypothetical protein